MKFQATITFEFQAGSLEEAGKKLNDALGLARERAGMEAKSTELRTPPSGTPVSVPFVATPGVPGPAGNGG